MANRLVLHFFSAMSLTGLLAFSTSEAGVSTAITSSGLGTTINQAGTTYNITGGTRPGGGTNLFHSFDLFNVGAGDTANFFNDTGLVTSNILGRVTGGNPSNIFGTVQTTGFGSANLFLINPAGVIFGPTASLNIGGSFHVSSADYIRFDDGSAAATKPRFYADPIQTSVLTSFSPDAFGFLNPNPAAIAVQGSTLQVPTGQTLSIVGGNRTFVTGAGDTAPSGVTVTGGTLKAPSGQISLVSVASPGEVSLPSFQPAPTMTLGIVNISQASSLDVSGDPGGTVLIRGGQFVLDNSTIAANTTGATNGAALAVDIAVTGDITITKNGGGPAISAQSQDAGDAGEVRISAGNLMATYELDFDFDNPTGINALIDTRGFGSGKGGNVTISAQNIEVQGGSLGVDSFIDTSNSADGPAGDISITGGQVHMTLANMNTGGGDPYTSTGTGRAGDIQFTADDLTLDQSFITSIAGQGGAVSITANTVTTSLVGVINGGSDGVGDVNIRAGRLVMNFDSSFLTGTQGAGPSGNVNVTVKSLELLQGSTIANETFGDGPAGQITVTATERVTASGDFVGTPSGFFTSSFGGGNAGPIKITTPTLELTAGGRINSATKGDGRGGDVTVVADNVLISGVNAHDVPPDVQFSVGNIKSSSIFTSTVGSAGDACSVRCGDSGNVTLSTKVLTLTNGGRIDSGSLNEGKGGDVTINASEGVFLSGTSADGTRSGILSVAKGTGNAGNITIGAGNSFTSTNSMVATSTAQSDGGNITIKAAGLVHLVNSRITTDVEGGLGNGGNINIDPPTVIVEGSKIVASAVGGNGGNINIVAGAFFLSPDSVIDASSTFGISGTINIESPISNLSGTLAPLPADIVQAASLLRTRCAAQLGGQISSFVVAGREGLPLEPGGLLPSPIFVQSQRNTPLIGFLKLPDIRVSQTFDNTDAPLSHLTGCGS